MTRKPKDDRMRPRPWLAVGMMPEGDSFRIPGPTCQHPNETEEEAIAQADNLRAVGYTRVRVVNVADILGPEGT